MNQPERDRFDALLEQVIADLPEPLRRLIDEVPVVVLDQPTPDLLVGLEPMDDEEAELLCGLHSGIAITHRSVENSGELPEAIHLFRRGIIDLAGGWDGPDGGEDAVREEICVTLLHEIGHHFGLDEDDLDRLGYA